MNAAPLARQIDSVVDDVLGATVLGRWITGVDYDNGQVSVGPIDIDDLYRWADDTDLDDDPPLQQAIAVLQTRMREAVPFADLGDELDQYAAARVCATLSHLGPRGRLSQLNLLTGRLHLRPIDLQTALDLPPPNLPAAGRQKARTTRSKAPSKAGKTTTGKTSGAARQQDRS